MNTDISNGAARLAVCSWSLQPKDPADLLDKLRATGMTRVQLALDPLRASPQIWGQTEDLLKAHGFSVVSGMVGCVGEDYKTMESIRLTGGVAPDATWEENRRNMRAAADLAQKMGLTLVTFHAGFVPEDENDPAYSKMRARLSEIADIFAAHGLSAGLETGQESAAGLAQLLRALNHPHLGVNFDPANMIMYDKGDPVQGLETLAPWVKQIHIKDSRRTKVPGTWGQEVVAGTGEVDWRAFFAVVKKAGLNVNFAIERERGGQRLDDIRAAKALVEQMFV